MELIIIKLLLFAVVFMIICKQQPIMESNYKVEHLEVGLSKQDKIITLGKN